MTDKERKFLVELLACTPSKFKRWMEGAQNALVLWAASMLGMVLGWLILAWLIHLLVNLEVGMRSPYALGVVSLLAPVCGLYAICSSVQWVRNWPDPSEALRQDISGGKVLDETYNVIEAKRFKEPEHGGLIYFLRMDDDRVLVIYDHESIALEMEGENALSSSFEPRRELHIVRAPSTEYILEQEFSGEKLELSAPVDLTVPPDQWPEQESWCEIPWLELERRLGMPGF
ncbi:hypothetical protein [Marinobacterium marinum]|nr:hypothetical protein [Marinobacterium marinum]